MLHAALVTYAARIRALRHAHPEVSEPALAPAFQQLLTECLPLIPAAPQLIVVPEFQNPGIGRPDIALKRPGQPARAFVELKHYTKPAAPERWTGAHDRAQYARLQTLGCWAASNFIGIYLFERHREISEATVVPRAALDPTTTEARAATLINAHDCEPFAALLARLAQAQAPAAATAQELAANLAFAARLVRSIVAGRLTELTPEANHPLQQVRAEFRDVLYAHPEAGGYTGASFDDLFAAAFAQTLAFGLLLVREASGQPVDSHAADHMPGEHPLMQTALQVLTLPQIAQDLGMGFEVMLDTVNSFAPALLAPQVGAPDPILYFYENFLAVFDPRARERYGVYYTPVEVVRFMVGALDRVLREHLGTTGLADHTVTLLDPAVGTGTFPLGIAERVKANATATMGPGMAHLALLELARRLYGFELLIGPYAVAHYRLQHALRPPPVPGQAAQPFPRLGVYLTDTLSRPGADAPQGPLGFVAAGIGAERREANRIKSEQPILAIIGNPPYRRLETGENETLVGRWMDELWDDLKAPVRNAGWGGELNTFPELSVAFWRWAMWKLFEADNAPRRGVIAFITNRKYLTGKPYAGLRQMMRTRFDRIEVYDLRGDLRRGERAGVTRDEGVFNIMVGTAITLAIADGSRAGQDAEVWYTDVWNQGLTRRAEKLAWLDEGAASGTRPYAVEVARFPLDDMRPGPFEDGAWPSVRQCFVAASAGLQSKRDQVVYDTTRDRLLLKLQTLCLEPDAEKRATFNPTGMNTYEAACAHGVDPALLRHGAYRPLDVRWHYPHRSFNDRPRTALVDIWGALNVGLYSMPAAIGIGPAVWCHGHYPDYHAFRGSYGGYAMPLYDRRGGDGHTNLRPALIAGLSAAYGTPVEPQDVFDAMLALLSATSYTTRFAEDLEDVFPHVPFPSSRAVFDEAAALGREIRMVETFTRPPGPAYLTPTLARIETTPSAGPLAAPEWGQGELLLRSDGSGRVSGIPEPVWQFEVSGYRLLPRWLGARQGQPVDAVLVEAIRDVAGRIAELLSLFAEADAVLARALHATLTCDSLGLGALLPQEGADEPV